MADKPKNLLSYSKQLAYKLRDPVSDGGGDGVTFYAEPRFLYLSRGFGKFIRNLENIGFRTEFVYPQFYNFIKHYFNNESKLKLDDSTNAVINKNEAVLNGVSISLLDLGSEPIFKPFKVIAKNSKTSYRGRKLNIGSAFEIMSGIRTEHYDETKMEDSFFWYIVNGSIFFAAKSSMKVSDIHILIKNPIPEFTMNQATDLYIPKEYVDLFLSYAALEAMMDIGNINKVTIYRKEVNDELTALGLRRKIKDSMDTTSDIENE